MKFLLPTGQTQDPENCKVPDLKKETEIKHYISFCSDSDLSIYEPTISKSETDISQALHSSQDRLSPSLDIVCAKDLVAAKDQQEEPEEEENATEVKVCTLEETTECADADLDIIIY